VRGWRLTGGEEVTRNENTYFTCQKYRHQL
jgi:hypothetical protein